MLRSLKTPILAGLVALAFAACGGGNTNPPPNGDGGAGDGPRVQFDGPRGDGGGLQQDGGGTQQDGGGGAECVASGGKPTAGLCKSNGDCTCPNNCGILFTDDPAYAGSCWKPCTATTDCGTGEECVGFTQTEGFCLPKGTLTGTGINGIAMLDAAPQLPLTGSANVVVAAGDINATMTVGYGRKSSSGTYYFIFLFGGTAAAPDQTKSVSIACDATKWSAKSYDLSKPTTDGCQIEYDVLGFNTGTGALTSYTMNAIVLDGTMTITAAGTGGGAAVTGTFAGPPTVVKIIEELCGPNSTAC